jgi:hypothetical protein
MSLTTFWLRFLLLLVISDGLVPFVNGPPPGSPGLNDNL